MFHDLQFDLFTNVSKSPIHAGLYMTIWWAKESSNQHRSCPLPQFRWITPGHESVKCAYFVSIFSMTSSSVLKGYSPISGARSDPQTGVLHDQHLRREGAGAHLRWHAHHGGLQVGNWPGGHSGASVVPKEVRVLILRIEINN